jgi:hypothetical protein
MPRSVWRHGDPVTLPLRDRGRGITTRAQKTSAALLAQQTRFSMAPTTPACRAPPGRRCAAPGRRRGGRNIRAARAPRWPRLALRVTLIHGFFPLLSAGVGAQHTMACKDGTTHEGSYEQMADIVARMTSVVGLIMSSTPSPQFPVGTGNRSQADGWSSLASSPPKTTCAGWTAHCNDGGMRSGCNGALLADLGGVAACAINMEPALAVSLGARADAHVPSHDPQKQQQRDGSNSSRRTDNAQAERVATPRPTVRDFQRTVPVLRSRRGSISVCPGRCCRLSSSSASSAHSLSRAHLFPCK